MDELTRKIQAAVRSEPDNEMIEVPDAEPFEESSGVRILRQMQAIHHKQGELDYVDRHIEESNAKGSAARIVQALANMEEQ